MLTTASHHIYYYRCQPASLIHYPSFYSDLLERRKGEVGDNGFKMYDWLIDCFFIDFAKKYYYTLHVVLKYNKHDEVPRESFLIARTTHPHIAVRTSWT